MNYFLLIHTSLDKAFAALAKDDRVLAVESNDQPREHGAFLHQAIDRIMEACGLDYAQLTAVGVTGGPGSYTGIRVGLSAAKGLAYSLTIPVVMCSTLLGLAASVPPASRDDQGIYVPVIHARKNEYYAGAYQSDLKPLHEDCLVIFDPEMPEIFRNPASVFLGIGVPDLPVAKEAVRNAEVTAIEPQAFANIVVNKFERGDIVSAKAASPLYLKEAYVTSPKGIT